MSVSPTATAGGTVSRYYYSALVPLVITVCVLAFAVLTYEEEPRTESAETTAATISPTLSEAQEAEGSGDGMLLQAGKIADFRPALRHSSTVFILSPEDADAYAHAFAAQDRGDWHAADEYIAQVSDKVLTGHLLYQRYMHPTAYRSTYEELYSWLTEYADHPGARRIYNLAYRRMPEGAAPPRHYTAPRKVSGSLYRGGRRGLGDLTGYRAAIPRTYGQKRAVDALFSRVNNYVRAGQPSRAMALLSDTENPAPVDRIERGLLLARIAQSYYYEGKVKRAGETARMAAALADGHAPSAYWILGLSAWRQGSMQKAADAFWSLSKHPQTGSEIRVAAAFWAHRCYRRLGDKVMADLSLKRAANAPFSLYGLLAQNMLDQRGDGYSWDLPSLEASHIELLSTHHAGRRALALADAGQRVLAAQELERLHPGNDAALEEALVAAADALGLPSFALKMGHAFRAPDGSRYDASLYPLPQWKPVGGFTVDKALLFALMRQESRFDPHAESHVGAEGLMQLMPQTVEHIERGQPELAVLRKNAPLSMPEVNMAFGQSYLRELLGSRRIHGNLIQMATAYNAGPAKLGRWKRRLKGVLDPLTFIESIPAGETRSFVKKIMANYWLYRMRLGQDTPSMDVIINRQWPRYAPQDIQQVAIR